MSYDTHARIYNGRWSPPSYRKSKGIKKKARRMFRARDKDGWSRKKSNGLRPQHWTSKKILREEYKDAF